MKKFISRIAIGIMTLSLLTCLACHANETPEVMSFSDVSPEYWGYEMIMSMTEDGIFKGTSTPVNGVGTFSPGKTMTRAEFITAALRAVDPQTEKSIELDEKQWWRGYYALALEKELLASHELNDGDMSKPMSREEMAMVLVRCVQNMGENLRQRVAVSQIADYDKIDSYYQEYVRDCFSYGLLCGVDSVGTFAPSRTLTRAEAATVLCRLIDKDMRVDVKFEEESTDDNRMDSYDEPETTERNDSDDKADNMQNDTTEKTESTDKTNDKVEETQKPETEADTIPAETEKPEDNDQQNDKTENTNSNDKTNNKVEEETEKSEQETGKIPAETEKPETEEEIPPETEEPAVEETMPWEEPGTVRPEDYTYEEFEGLTAAQQMAFQNAIDFNTWLEKVQGGEIIEETMPWDKPGAVRPEDYTYEEFENLTAAQQMAFQNAIDFDVWLEKVQGGEIIEEVMPWDKPGAVRPEDYTYEEFEGLTAAQQMAFQNAIDFDVWLEKVQGGEIIEEVMPWDKPGAVRPEDYTYEEFEGLTAAQQMAFQNSFNSFGDFEAWMERENQQ